MTRRFFLYNALVFVCLFTINVAGYSKVYRISQNELSFEKQMTTILDEINKMPGDESVVIRIDKGYYAISNTIDISIRNHPVDIIGSKNNTTIISGSIEVTGWEEMPNGLWISKIPRVENKDYIPDQLYVNGKKAIRSRIPNKGVFEVQNATKNELSYGARLKKNDIEMIPFISSDDIPILTIFHKWTSSKRYLDRVSITDNTLVFSGIEFPSYNQLEFGNGVVVENTKTGLDTPGEWCVDKRGYIYYWPKEGELIDKTIFRIPVVEKILTVKSSGNISIKSIVFEHTTFQLPKEGVEYVQAASGMSAAIEIDDVNSLAIENCEIRNVANYGIWFRHYCRESMVLKNHFHDLGAGAIKIGTLGLVNSSVLTNHITVDNNIINNYGQLIEGAVGIILFNASDCKITHNDIHFGNYTGVSLGWEWGSGASLSWNNEVAYNRISHIGDGRLNDMGGIYTLGMSKGTTIHHNILSDITAGNSKAWGIYTDEGTTGVLIENNLVYRCTSGGFHQNYGSNNIVKNNIFAWGKQSQLSFASPKGEYPLICSHNIIIMETGALFSGNAIRSEKFVVDSNCYWSISSEMPNVGSQDILKWIEQKDSTSVFKDPNFKDPQKADFRLKNKSICKIIGFKPFDYSKSGVYGKRKWKNKAASLKHGKASL